MHTSVILRDGATKKPFKKRAAGFTIAELLLVTAAFGAVIGLIVAYSARQDAARVCTEKSTVVDVLEVTRYSANVKFANGQAGWIPFPNFKKGDDYCLTYAE